MRTGIYIQYDLTRKDGEFKTIQTEFQRCGKNYLEAWDFLRWLRSRNKRMFQIENTKFFMVQEINMPEEPKPIDRK